MQGKKFRAYMDELMRTAKIEKFDQTAAAPAAGAGCGCARRPVSARPVSARRQRRPPRRPLLPRAARADTEPRAAE